MTGKRIAVTAALLLVGAAAGLGLASALEPFVHETDLRAELPPCFEVGIPYHHRFRASCSGMLDTPRGPVPFSLNEDGLRDISRTQILKRPRRVLVVGDSFVEGWWADSAQTLPAGLSANFPGVYFINAGLRSTGPMIQAARLPALLDVYRPERILWLLNDTDSADDRLACSLLSDPGARAERMAFTLEDFALEGTEGRLAAGLGNWPLGRWLKRNAYQEKWRELVHGAAAERCGACRGISELARLATARGIPLLALYLPVELGAVYAGESSPRAQIVSCLEKSGVPYFPVELSALSPQERESIFWEKDFHLNPEGVTAVVDLLKPKLGTWLERGR